MSNVLLICDPNLFLFLFRMSNELKSTGQDYGSFGAAPGGDQAGGRAGERAGRAGERAGPPVEQAGRGGAGGLPLALGKGGSLPSSFQPRHQMRDESDNCFSAGVICFYDFLKFCLYFLEKQSFLFGMPVSRKSSFLKFLVARRVSALKLNFLFKFIELQTPPPPHDRYNTTSFDLLDDRVRGWRSLHANSQVLGWGRRCGSVCGGGGGGSIKFISGHSSHRKNTGSSLILLVNLI